MRKKCFLDLETTGLDPGPGVILSMGFSLGIGKEFEIIIKPTKEEWEAASPRALEVNGMTMEFLDKYGIPLEEAKQVFLSWLIEEQITNENYVFFAQNAPFDKKWLLYFMSDVLAFADAPKVWVDLIPIYKHVGAQLGLNVHYQNTHHISQQVDVPEEPKPHTAINGARAVRRNYEGLKMMALKQGVLFDY